MAQPLIKFYRSADAPTSAPIGSLWFSTEDSTIKVRKAVTDENPITDWESYGGDSIEIAATDSTNRNFLELEGDALAVRGMATSATTTTKAITVEGGPLANDITETGEEWPFATVNGNRTIPAGTDIQTILEKLFLKEKWATPTTPVPATLTVSVTAPTPTFSASSKSGSLVEVGDTITVNKITANAVSVGGTKTTSVSGFTYGYSKADDNTKDSAATSVSVTRANPVANKDDKYSMTVTPFGMTGTSVPPITDNATASNVTCDSFKGRAVYGENKVTVSETGIGYTAQVPELPVYYACSNVGNTHDSQGTTKPSTKVKATTLSADAPSDSQSASLKGVYAIYSTGTLYSGGFTTSEQDAAAYNAQSEFEKFSCATSGDNAYVLTRLALTDLTNGTTAFYGYIGFGTDNDKVNKIIYLPAGWKIEEVNQPSATVSGAWNISCTFNQVGQAFAFTNNSGAVSNYTKWVITGFTATDSVKVKIVKE